MLLYSAHRRPQAQRRVDKHWLQQSEAAAQALQPLCRTAFAWAADARHARATLAHGLQGASLSESTLQPQPRSSKRGRPGPGTPPPQVVYDIPGALPSALAAPAALVAPQSCCSLATNERDEGL